MIRVLALTLALIVSACTLFARPISVSEINYNPLDGSDYEFLELINSGAVAVSLTGATFTNGIEYTFGSTTLQPNQRIVICSDRSSFAARYGDVAQLAPSKYKGSLNNAGEEISLVSATGELLFQFKYDSSGKWPSRANGLGSTLEVVDPNGDLSDPDNWRSSAEYNGTPGTAGVGPQRTVVINEILAHTDPPLEDAIELYNNLSTPVNVSGWFISNSRNNPFKFKIPNNSIIPGKGYLVIYEYQFNVPGDDNAFTFNSAHGDEAVLLSADANEKPLLWMDATTFEASENGVSFARYPNGTGPLLISSDLSFGTAVRKNFPESFLSEFRKGKGESNKAPKVGPLITTRIQYNPPINGDEFIEIQNITEAPVALYDTEFPTNSWKLESAVQYTFPTNLWLGPGEKLIVSGVTPEAFRSRQTIPSDVVAVLGPWVGLLNNAGDTIALFKPDPPQGPQHPDFGFVPYILVEEIHYDSKAPWPVGPSNGFAIQRKTSGYGDDAANWELEASVPVDFTVSTTLVGNTVQLRFDVPSGYIATVETRSNASTGTWAVAQSYPAQASARSQTYAYTLDGTLRVFRIALSR